MNIGEWLSGTLSLVQNIREECTRNLEAASHSDFTSYIGLLTEVLVNPAADTAVRTAAALQIKNSLVATEESLKNEKAAKWQSIDPSLRSQIKQAILGNLDSVVGQQTAQAVAAIASLDLPRHEWPQLIQQLLVNMTNAQSSEQLKTHSMSAVGYICEQIDAKVLETQADSILTAVINGARKDEPSNRVRTSALKALSNSLYFVKANFARANERNIIMQVVCEATQATDASVQLAAYECLNKIVELYYQYMQFYMKNALYAVTIFSMQSQNPEVVLLAIEFWSTLCDKEILLAEEEDEALHLGEPVTVKCMHFVKDVLKDLVPVLFWLMTKQDEDADEDEWNPSMAAATCMSLISQAVGAEIVQHTLYLIEKNLRSANWHDRDAAVTTFGSILDGPDPKILYTLVSQALPYLLEILKDPSPHVKETAAWTLGRICQYVILEMPKQNHAEIIQALLGSLNQEPRIVSSACWALMNFADNMRPESPEEPDGPLTMYFESVVGALLQTAAREDNESNIRTSAYEALSSWIASSSNESFPIINQVGVEILNRLEACTQHPVVSPPLAELVSNLCALLCNLIRRLDKHVKPAAPHIMDVLLRIINLSGSSKATTALEDAFICIGALASALEGEFASYAGSAVTPLLVALANPEEHALCGIAVGVVIDFCRALEGQFIQYSDTFMEVLGGLIMNERLYNSIKPTIITCFGDIALAIGMQFQKYLTAVMEVLVQQSRLADSLQNTASEAEFVFSIREALVQALTGILQALSTGGQTQQFVPYVQFTMEQLHNFYNSGVKQDDQASRDLAGLLGDMAMAFGSNLKELLSAPWVNHFLTYTAKYRGFERSTRDSAKWAKEQIRLALK